MIRRGLSIIETLIALFVMGVIFAGVFTVFMALNRAQVVSVRLPTAQQHAQQMALTVAGAIRRSTLCTATDSGCTLDSAIQDTSTTGLTVYLRSGSALVP